MAASLSYEPDPNPTATVTELIIKEAAALSRIWDHWAEPYCFLRRSDGRLFGNTKVSLAGFTGPTGDYIQVKLSDDIFMMAHQVDMLLSGISGWAKGYKLTWKIGLEGMPVGIINSDGGYSDDLSSFLSELHSAAETPQDPEAVKKRVSSLRAKYAQRNP